MPGPLAHLGYGLGLGLTLRSVSSGRFSDVHTFVYAVNCFIGPDIGTFLEWVTRHLGLGTTTGVKVMELTHDPFLYPLAVSPLLAVIWMFLLTCNVTHTAANIRFQYRLARRPQPLPWLSCWALCAAGGLSHFALDIPFEEDGREPFYLWIMSTGYWEKPYVDAWCVIVLGLLIGTLLVGYLLINAQISPNLSVNSIANQSTAERMQVVQTGRLLLAILATYIVYLVMRLYVIGGPRVPVIGEEADLGVVTFLVYFFLFPLLLLASSCNSSWVMP